MCTTKVPLCQFLRIFFYVLALLVVLYALITTVKLTGIVTCSCFHISNRTKASSATDTTFSVLGTYPWYSRCVQLASSVVATFCVYYPYNSQFHDPRMALNFL